MTNAVVWIQVLTFVALTVLFFHDHQYRLGVAQACLAGATLAIYLR